MNDQLFKMGIVTEMFWEMEKTYFDDTDDMGPLVQKYAIEHAAELWTERAVESE